MTAATVWHPGERALQERSGVGARMAEVGARVVRSYMPDQHREFFAELPLVYAATLDPQGQPWASVLAGPPGFIDSPAPDLLRVRSAALPHERWREHLRVGAPVGLLGLQAHTRRRNRMNGRVLSIADAGFEVRVDQSFGNCPKYIQPREALHSPASAPATVRALGELDAAALRIVRGADTFFIATTHPQAQVSGEPAAGLDMSHRGGPTGFVRAQDDGTLLVPDYVGNSFFNTFGNLQLEPRCGLLFIDFASGDRLHIAAHAELVWQGPEVAALPGALRALRLRVQHATHVAGGLPLQFREAGQP
jgi:predicted pyridoxine 5'-phosphate oxidase superfamily flavin-nucleotide-binding protein